MALSVEKQVGIFFLLALVVLGIMIEVVEDWRPFEKHVSFKTYFRSAIGINLGDPVRMAGVEVGKIEKIGIEGQQIRIDFYVQEGTDLREDTIASVRQTNLLGGQFLGLTFGTPQAAPLPAGSTVPSRESSNVDELITNLDRNQEKVFGQLGDLVVEVRDNLADMVVQLGTIVNRIEQGQGTLGRLVNDPELYDGLRDTVASLNRLLARVDRGEGTLGRLVSDPGLYDSAATVVANLEDISGRLRDGQGSLGRLLTEDEVYDSLVAALASIRSIAAKADDGQGALGRLVNEPELYEEFLGLVARLNSIAAKVDDGRGTLGRLVNEDDLYQDAKTTLHKVEKTVDGMSDSGPLSALGVVIGTFF